MVRLARSLCSIPLVRSRSALEPSYFAFRSYSPYSQLSTSIPLIRHPVGVLDRHPAESGYVITHMSTSTSCLDVGKAGPRGNSTAGHLDVFMHDPPDQPQPQTSSRQVHILSSFLPVCMHTYRVIESSDATFEYYQSLLIVTLPTALTKDPSESVPPSHP